MEREQPKYIVLSTLGAFLLPIATFLWFYLAYDFINPDGTPDNAPIRSLPALSILAVITFIFLLYAFTVLGNVLYKSIKPSYKPGLMAGAALALPLPLIVLFSSSDHSQTVGVGYMLYMAVILYAYLFISFIIGSALQVILIKKHNNSHSQIGAQYAPPG